MNLTQPGEQDVIIGRVPPLLKRCRSSLPSSMMVRSAVKSVSKTLSKPSRLRPATIFPVTRLPAGIPNSSPIAARTAGAVCTTTCLVGVSQRIPDALGVADFSERSDGTCRHALPAGNTRHIGKLLLRAMAR